jgi:hypothetical protein
MELELTSISSIRLSIYPDRMCDIHATGSWQYPNGQITTTTTQATCIRALVRVLRKTNRLVTLILSTSNDSREPPFPPLPPISPPSGFVISLAKTLSATLSPPFFSQLFAPLRSLTPLSSIASRAI